MNEQFTENDLITYTNTLAALIVSSNAPVAEKNNILQRLQAVTAEITKEKISIEDSRNAELFSYLENLRKTIEHYSQRTLYPVKKWTDDPQQYDMVPAFDDIVHRGNFEESIKEVRFAIEQMRNIPEDKKKDYLKNVDTVEKMFRNSVDHANNMGKSVHSSVIRKAESYLEAVYWEVTGLNNNGETPEMGGLVGLILKGFKALSGK